ncbi:TonB-dependent receptor [Paraglaciecola sp.]|uniref:TonB-dependent receptor n=2 Tax=Paraglaciecola sp. TaxID=1920173 RepID=UPI00387E91DD
MNINGKIKPSKLAMAISLAFLPITGMLTSQTAIAQEATPDTDQSIETIQVTATRRAGTVQDVPINISAISPDLIEQQDISELEDIAKWTPGLTITDQGGRSNAPIIVRGLNTNSSGPGSNGGTVATYVGEIPLLVNMRLIDMDRVEVLIGPQGTLYGAGTLGGAIRYIPNAVELDMTTLEIFGDLSQTAESDSMGAEGGFIVNVPLITDELGFRMSLNYLNDPGFIDYNYLVQEPGVSLPDPDWDDPDDVAANLYSVADANGEKALTTRAALTWKPTEWLESTLTYFYQNTELEGRSISQYNSLSSESELYGQVGKYESAYRYLEPFERTNDLLSLEVKADLGFAELVSATGFTGTETIGNRDQTDLLIRLSYGYEEFPSFAAYTEDAFNRDTFTQEIRLVSTNEGPFSWIVGGYYNKDETDGYSIEYAPGFDEFAIEVWGVDGFLRPDSIEYYSQSNSETIEKAVFGEVSYEISDKWNVTLGLRQYWYEVSAASAVDLPLFYTTFLGRDPDSLEFDFESVYAEDDGNLFKFNTSYQFTDDVLGYFTVSEGFRIGGANDVAACPDNIDEIDTQIICALPNEQLYSADTTVNYEIGLKTAWFKNKFYLNAALFNVDWNDAQVNGATINGSVGYTANAEGANAKGFELSSRATFSDSLSAYATYSYAKAELTADAPFLFGVFDEDVQYWYDGSDGDRLPGSPESSFAFGLVYNGELMGKALDLTYGLTAQSDVYSKVGLKDDGEIIPGYALSNISAKLSDDDWSVTFYVNNLFDKYAFTSTRGDLSQIGLGQEINQNRSDLTRGYGHYINTPRTVGMKFKYTFEM